MACHQATPSQEEASKLLIIVPCPECDVPAEITGQFTLASTDGPVDHVAVTCAAGHRFRMPADMLARRRPRKRLIPRTIQLCVRCRQNPAGFWISGRTARVAHRPWCLSCCQCLDAGRYEVIPFGA
jgi:hypothetical protein